MDVTRRRFMAGMATVATAAAVPALAQAGAGRSSGAAVNAPAPVRDGHTALTPREALQLLIDGNRDFVSEAPTDAPVGRRRRLEIAQAQAPFAAYVTCSDSRVSPEILFGRGLGELFIIRNAGNTVDTVAQGSVEYAVAELKTPLVVVMGHQRCGAVKAAVEVVRENRRFPGAIGKMVEPIVPAVLQVQDAEGDLVENAVRANVRRVVQDLRTTSEPMLLEPQRAGRVMVVGAYYYLDSGRVDFFDLPEHG